MRGRVFPQTPDWKWRPNESTIERGEMAVGKGQLRTFHLLLRPRKAIQPRPRYSRRWLLQQNRRRLYWRLISAVHRLLRRRFRARVVKQLVDLIGPQGNASGSGRKQSARYLGLFRQCNRGRSRHADFRRGYWCPPPRGRCAAHCGPLFSGSMTDWSQTPAWSWEWPGLQSSPAVSS